MNKYSSGKIDLDITVLEPICHGERTSGNHTLIRTRPVIQPDGAIVDIPFVSSNSIRHLIREAGARHAFEVMEIPDGSLSQAVIDLLGSGGQLSKKGTVVNAAKARNLEAKFPILKLLGYAAGNTIWQGALSVSHWNLVCAENRAFFPEWVHESPLSQVLADISSWEMRCEEMGTRMDAKRTPAFERKLPQETSQKLLDVSAEKAELKSKGKKDPDEIRMLYTFDAISKGAKLWGDIIYTDLTEMDLCALVAALAYASKEKLANGAHVMHVGAKSNGGYGRVGVKFQSSRRINVKAPEFVADGNIDDESFIDPYTRHLRENRKEIMDALTAATL